MQSKAVGSSLSMQSKMGRGGEWGKKKNDTNTVFQV